MDRETRDVATLIQKAEMLRGAVDATAKRAAMIAVNTGAERRFPKMAEARPDAAPPSTLEGILDDCYTVLGDANARLDVIEQHVGVPGMGLGEVGPRRYELDPPRRSFEARADDTAVARQERPRGERYG